ncbi:glycosyltransferase family 39 protein [Candidatus Gottesmanbacteria bacterium]|nr:glycosyltransferase family 39 protein [Candidatus Gottesmanbacteria bacterium]
MKLKIILLAIILIAGFLRFYNLNFGSPYFFNPDERNMAIAITKLSFPKSMNPHFFAYGQLPLYLAYYSERAATVSFSQAIFWLRFWSAVASVLTIFVVYKITKIITQREKYALISALLTSFTPGLIQSAHFGTTESLLTFLFMLIIYLSLTLQGQTFRAIILGSLTGIAIATKVSALIFIAVPVISVLVHKIKTVKKVILLLILIIFSSVTSALLSPYNLLDFKEFKGSMNYESSVATGKFRVFYTRQFENTIPVLFQFEKVFPYALGTPILIFGSIGFLILCLKFKTYFILFFSFLIYFIPNSFLYAKWTRFMTPVIPLFAIFAAYFIFRLKLNKLIIYLIIISTIIPGIYFFSIYTKPDIRVVASEWIYNNIPEGSYILSETANVIDIPLQNQKSKIKNQNYTVISFNFYELDNEPSLVNQLLNHLEKADYIFIPSRRIFANHRQYPDKYPITSKYYELLFSGKLGFEKTSEFYVLNDETAEETFSVFDHPKIRIYKKSEQLTSSDYFEMLINDE